MANPVVANTGTARSPDGYQAALATAESDSYPIVVKDEPHSFLRINAKSARAGGHCPASTFDIQAWPGSVDVYLRSAPDCVLSESDLKDLHHEGMNLAWGISQRARMLAGEPLGPGYPSATYFDTPQDYRRLGAPPPR